MPQPYWVKVVFITYLQYFQSQLSVNSEMQKYIIHRLFYQRKSLSYNRYWFEMDTYFMGYHSEVYLYHEKGTLSPP